MLPKTKGISEVEQFWWETAKNNFFWENMHRWTVDNNTSQMCKECKLGSILKEYFTQKWLLAEHVLTHRPSEV